MEITSLNLQKAQDTGSAMALYGVFRCGGEVVKVKIDLVEWAETPCPGTVVVVVVAIRRPYQVDCFLGFETRLVFSFCPRVGNGKIILIPNSHLVLG
jgi:hypothetical protein